ncbi:DUF3301 domain-containing protein [Bermanella marisrubri]|uniref:DUF3301 domain-containing protein n=1 Tax=Bermanella marisrubri TaxID=207949 RepID=Q1N6R6_9GAMM|nr:DUF3301 domain-containing protein [Bermanella marisrubri]EAT13526.1 hypothetical protein RED65_09049 [Oceanobacter sp. RED65] [Bermanella marisrubri]QIZ84326.1 DUF3301 domain-containing protein [Bermanella marisrubri]
MQLNDLVILFICFIIAAFWWHDRGIKQAAYTLAVKMCEERDVQLLDQNIRICRWMPKLDKDKGPHIMRTFRFEFTHTGERRYTGHLIMRGNRFSDFELQPYHI